MFLDILTESTPTNIGLFFVIGVTISENSDIGSDEVVCMTSLVDKMSVGMVVGWGVVVVVVGVVEVVVDVVVVVVVVVVDVVVDVVVLVVVCSVVVVVGTVVVVGFEVIISGSDVVNFSAIAMKDGKSSNNEVIVVVDI